MNEISTRWRGVVTHSIDTFNSGARFTGRQTSSNTTWDTANRAIYVPIVVPHPVVVRKLWFGNNVTATGNYDLGLYDASGNKILSRGSTVKPASSTEAVWDCTDTVIGGGIYYMALNSDTATDGFAAELGPAPMCAMEGVLIESLGSVTLPTTASWSLDQTLAKRPVMGMFLSSIPS